MPPYRRCFSWYSTTHTPFQNALLGRRTPDTFWRGPKRRSSHLARAEQVTWLARLEGEHDNLRAVLRWALEADEVLLGLRVAAALGWFWWVHGHYSEGRGWLDGLLARAGGLETTSGATAVRALALSRTGLLAHALGDRAGATTLFQESLAIYQKLGDDRGISIALSNLALVAWVQGDYARATVLCEESLTLSRTSGDKAGYLKRAALPGAGSLLAERLWARNGPSTKSLALWREVGDKGGIAAAIGNLAFVAQEQGDYVEARALHEESLALRRELGDTGGIALTLTGLGFVAREPR